MVLPGPVTENAPVSVNGPRLYLPEIAVEVLDDADRSVWHHGSDVNGASEDDSRRLREVSSSMPGLG